MTFTYAYITLLPREQRESSHITQVVQFWWFERWQLRKLIPLNAFAGGLAEEFSFVDFLILIYLHYVWLGARRCCLRVQVLPCLRVVLGCYDIGNNSPGPQSVSMQTHGLSVWTNRSWVAAKYSFYGMVRGFRLILAFFEQKVPKTWGRSGSVKN